MTALDRNLPQMVDVAALIPYGRNARTHSEEQIEQIKESFRQFGFTGVLAYDDQGLAIGHGRQRALLEMWETGEDVFGPGKRDYLPKGKAPAIDITGLSDSERKALIIADNKIALNAGWDEGLLAAELRELEGTAFDLSGLGFDERELKALFDPPGPKLTGQMATEFLIAPFSVLNAREGWWQDRKRQWLGLGIQSEIGRGENLLKMSDTMLEPDPDKRAEMQAARAAQRRDESGESVYLKGSLNLEITTDPYRKNGKRKAATFGQDLMRGEGTNVVPGQRHVPGGLVFGEMNINPGAGGAPSGTSIFDPVLCELAYRWFSPQGGRVLDPFAGGSVRGIVAAALGRQYVGIDLRREQIEANRSQWPGVAAQLGGDAAPAEESPVIQIDEVEGFRIVRDDLVLGGTKRRALDRLLAGPLAEHAEFIYASPAYGFAQIALAAACRQAGKKATIVVAGRKQRHPRTQLAADLGAELVEIGSGAYLTVIQKRARDLAAERGAYLVPFGMEDEIFVEAIADLARELPGDPPAEVWSVAGSGVLTRALQRAWPDATFHAVQIGKAVDDPGRARLWEAPEKFEADARQPPPFPSCSNYDAKAWQFMRKHAAPGALFWNVGADITATVPNPAPAEPSWYVGDSSDLLSAAAEPDQIGEGFDMIFSCPPYGDLEIYSDDPADISNMESKEFNVAYARIIRRAVDRLADNRFACFVVGDYRDKRGIYRNFVSRTIEAFQHAGAMLYNEAILVTAAGSLPIRAAKQFRTTRKLGKTHQNILIFVKGDPRKATEACGPVDVSGALADIEPEDEG